MSAERARSGSRDCRHGVHRGSARRPVEARPGRARLAARRRGGLHRDDAGGRPEPQRSRRRPRHDDRHEHREWQPVVRPAARIARHGHGRRHDLPGHQPAPAGPVPGVRPGPGAVGGVALDHRHGPRDPGRLADPAARPALWPGRLRDLVDREPRRVRHAALDAVDRGQLLLPRPRRGDPVHVRGPGRVARPPPAVAHRPRPGPCRAGQAHRPAGRHPVRHRLPARRARPLAPRGRLRGAARARRRRHGAL